MDRNAEIQQALQRRDYIHAQALAAAESVRLQSEILLQLQLQTQELMSMKFAIQEGVEHARRI